MVVLRTALASWYRLAIIATTPEFPLSFLELCTLVDFSSFLEVLVFYFRVLMVEVDLQPVLSYQPYPVSRA